MTCLGSLPEITLTCQDDIFSRVGITGLHKRVAGQLHGVHWEGCPQRHESARPSTPFACAAR
jgi:hypothetical protein